MSKILSIGEILWDVFPDDKQPGGSPANLAYHAHCLGHQSLLASRTGEDRDGDELIRFFRKKGLSTRLIQKDREYPTGRVTVTFRDEEPSYTIHQPAAWDSIELAETLMQEISDLDAFCFASLSQRSEKTASTIHKLLKLLPPSCLKIFDANLRPPFVDRDKLIKSIELADVIKLNEKELQLISNWFTTKDLPDFLLTTWPKKIILVTLGADGSAMYTRNNTLQQKAFPISEEGDFVGVGDAFLACFTHLMLSGTPEEQILIQANRYAALVASQKGGMPELDADEISNLTTPTHSP